MVWYNPWTWGDDSGSQASFKPVPVDPYNGVNPYEGMAPPPPPTNAGSTTTSRQVNPYNPQDVGDPNAPYAMALQSKLNNDNRGLEGIQQGQYLTLRNEGTTHSATVNENPYQKNFDPYTAAGGYDQRNYMYGRTPGGADLAANRAWETGQQAQDFGTGMQDVTWQAAQNYSGRQAQMGDFGQQNAALQGARGYGQQLAGLEATQGPSAAQAQLQAGTNAAMGGQLALARSGRGFGGGAAAAGLAQGNLVSIQANAANEAAMLRAQEDAAWRGRQASNFANAAGIQQGIGNQYGQQAAQNLNAYYQNQGMNDQAALGFAGMGIDAATQGYQTNLAGQGVASQIRGQEMTGGMAQEDNILREMAARQGWSLGQQQRQDQKEAGYLAAGANILGGLIS